MKIVHVFKDFYPPLFAGITGYIADISNAMAERGHEVEVHVAGVRYSRRDRLPSGVVVHRHREIARALSMPIAPGLVSEVRRLNADVIHVHLPNPIGELGAALNTHARCVCTFHSQLVRQRALEPMYAPLRARLLDRSRRILVSSEMIGRVPELVAHRAKVQVLPFGVSPRLVGRTRTNLADSAAIRPEAGPLRLLFVGRLVYYKGIDVLMKALSLTAAANLRIIGDGADRHRLEALSVQLGVDNRTQFLGSLPDDDLLRAFRETDVFVLPSVSRAETFGLAMVEAMGNGLPAISTSLGTGTDWVNLNDVTGLVVEPGDASALARAIDRLTDRDLRARLGAGALERVQQMFSFDRHVDALEAAYREAAI
jgi:glycosyltransferase involved in cell wall biosynthesis